MIQEAIAAGEPVRTRTRKSKIQIGKVQSSVYFPCDLPTPPPTPELERLVNHCKKSRTELLIGADSNSHLTAWGSSNTNNRAELEFFVYKNFKGDVYSAHDPS